MQTIKTTYVECDCHDPSHLCRFTLDNCDGEELPLLICDICLVNYRGFWWRLWMAIKFVFGYDDLGWEEIILEDEQIAKIRDVFNQFELNRAKYWSKDWN